MNPFEQKKSDSEEEDDIPLTELARSLKARKSRLKQKNEGSSHKEITQDEHLKEGLV